MLLQLKIENFLSYKNEVVFDMTASSLKEKNPELLIDPIFEARNEKILRTAAIYGANGSGKSNLLKAIEFIIETVTGKKDSELWQNFNYSQSNPFILNTDSVKKPSCFEMSFIINSIEYRYGFKFLNSIVESEWLHKTKERETKIFIRERQEFDINNEYKVLTVLEQNKMIKPESLLLGLASTFNEINSITIVNYFKNFHFFDTFDIGSFIKGNKLTPRLEEELFRQKLLRLLQKADTGIDNINFVKDKKEKIKFNGIELENIFSDFLNKQLIESTRNVYDNKNKLVGKLNLPFSQFESEGTRKFFDIALYAIEVLEKGGILVIDEIDTKFHPILTENLIRLFYDKEMNPNNAQLIFSTHNTNLMDSKVLRRDQIWLTEKDSFGETRIFPLSQFKTDLGKSVRNDEAIEKNYLEGKYGAIPIISGLN
jgi:AAA15 family ATPase/GTPase